MARSCSNCRRRMSYERSMLGDMCIGWEMSETEEECIETAATCERYCEETEEDRERRREEREYTPSATNGDYSPSCPWNAPGMSIRDFI